MLIIGKLVQKVTWKIITGAAMLLLPGFTAVFYRAGIPPERLLDMYASRTDPVSFKGTGRA